MVMIYGAYKNLHIVFLDMKYGLFCWCSSTWAGLSLLAVSGSKGWILLNLFLFFHSREVKGFAAAAMEMSVRCGGIFGNFSWEMLKSFYLIKD